MMLSTDNLYSLHTPKDIQKQMASDLKRVRLETKGWKRDTLAEKSGVPSSTIKRFESTGEISLRQVLMLAHALDMLDRFTDILTTDIEGMSMDNYIKKSENKSRSRGKK
jgi:transcriptional regulator with XRE-family HTH domain